MTIYYSKSTNGFYLKEINGDDIPVDKVEITKEQHSLLLEGQSEGKKITSDSLGNPMLVTQDIPVEVPPTKEELLAKLLEIQAQLEVLP